MNSIVDFSSIHFTPKPASMTKPPKAAYRSRKLWVLEKLKEHFASDPALKARFDAVTTFSRQIRVSEYHLTNACNIRCEGCWFYEFGHDKETREEKDISTLSNFLDTEVKTRKINSALVIGGEPAMFLERLSLYQAKMRFLTVSSNGLKPIPLKGFENLAIGLSLFGGGPLDDQLRAIKPSGKRFEGLFDKALDNYKDDTRAVFIYAITEDGIDYIEDTVEKIHRNGNQVSFNFYSKYGTREPSAVKHRAALTTEALRVKALYQDTVISPPYFIKTMISGQSHWDSFGYKNCPSISVDHPAHQDRLRNGMPSLPLFNTWSADLKTIKFCCTSGHCLGCRDSQAVSSWLLVSMSQFLETSHQLQTWVEIAESYWSQFIWSPFFKHKSSSDSTNIH